jgi:hypothetical protein
MGAGSGTRRVVFTSKRDGRPVAGTPHRLRLQTPSEIGQGRNVSTKASQRPGDVGQEIVLFCGCQLRRL